MPNQPADARNQPHMLTGDVAQLATYYSPDPSLTFDRAGRVLAANPAAFSELGYSADQLIGRVFRELLDHGSRAKADQLLEQAASGSTAVYELNQNTADGRVILVSYRALPLPAPHDGTLLLGRLMSTAIAATERLIALNRRLNTLFAITSVASRSIVLADLLQEVLALALIELQAQAGLVLLTDSSVLGTPADPTDADYLTSLYLAAQQGFAPEFTARLRDNPALLVPDGGFPSPGEPLLRSGSAEELGFTPFDIDTPVGPLLSLVCVPLRTERQSLGWLYMLTDRYRAFGLGELEMISTIADLLGPPVENARLYGALRETSGQLSAVLDNIDSGVLLVDLAGTLRYANPQIGALLGTDVRDWPGRDRAAALSGFLRSFEQASALFDGQLWITTSAPVRFLQCFVAEITDSAGVRSGTIEVYSDVTAIQEMNRTKDEFVAAAAHDLKTPVTAVKGYTQIAMRMARRLNEPRLVQQLEIINSRSDELSYLMDTLLDMSRIQSGRLQFYIEPFVLSGLIDKVVQYFDFDLQRRQRAITLDLPSEPIIVEWDRPRVERVLINLIGNAIKYAPEGGDIAVRVRDLPSDAIELAITDHGIGIAPQEREQIFERFYRVRQAVEQGFKGTGLGLYICQSVVTALGGRIWAADALHGGRGSTIYVVLPRQVEA